MTKKACKRRYPRIKPKIKKYWEGGTTGSFLDTETTNFNKKIEDYQKQSTGTTSQLPSYLQNTTLTLTKDPKYNSLASNTKSNNSFKADFSGFGTQPGSNSQQNQNGYSLMSDPNMGTYGAVAQLGTSILQGAEDNPNNQIYGTSGVSSAGSAAASLGGPVASTGASVLGLIGTGVDQAFNLQDYSDTGVDKSSSIDTVLHGEVSTGSAYAQATAGFDQMGELTKNVEEGKWDNVVIDLLGGAQYTGQKNYNEEQDEAVKREAAAYRQEQLNKITSRNQLASLESKSTMMYPDGGTVNNTYYKRNKDITYTYANMHKTFGKDTNMVAGDMQVYDKPRYITSMPDTGNVRALLNNQKVTSNGSEMFGISDSDTNGVLTRRKRTYTDKRTGTVYEIPMVDSDTFKQYFPEAKTGYATGGVIQEPNAELEKGEPFRTPDGAIHKVSDNAPTHAQGGVQMNLPEGTEILGKLEMYNKDKKFKEAGTKLKQMYDKYNKQLTENTSTVNKGSAELMMNKVQNKFSQLVAEQEAKAQAKQAKKYAKGGVVPKYAWPDDSNNYSMTIPRIGTASDGGTGYIYSIPGSRRASTYEDPIYHTSSLGRGWDTIRNNKETIGAVAGTAAQLAPAAYNIYQGLFGKEDTMKYSDYANPYRQAILNSIKNRKYNVEPELAANELAYQTGKRNIKQIAPSAGNLLSNYSALAGMRMRADGEALARKQNMDNQYGGEGAQILSQLGAQESGTKFSVSQYNKAAKAAKQGATSTGIDQFAGAVTNMQIGKNLQKNDTMRFSAFESAMRDVGIDINTKEGKATLKYIMDNASKGGKA